MNHQCGNRISFKRRTAQRRRGGWAALGGALFLLAAAPPGRAAEVSPEEMQQMRQWLAAHSGEGAQAPFSLLVDGKPWAGHGATVVKPAGAHRREHETVFADPAAALEVRCAMVEYEDAPTLEWTVYLRNTGSNDTPVISDLQALDASFERSDGEEFTLRHWAGSQATPDDYRPFQDRLGPKAEKRLAPSGGRGSDGVWPYFNIDWGNQGVIAVVGWPGQWSASFARDDKHGLRVRAGQELTHFRLKPGEEARTPLIVLQFWNGGDWVRAQNVWRQWMREHNVPRLNGQLPPPLLPASSGNQLSEMQKANEQNQVQFIDGYLRRGIQLDFWWMDAGWYTFREGWWNVGTWEVDRNRFPNGLRAVSDHAHQHGVRTLVWFEPERVTPGTWLYQNHPEWLLGRDGEQKLLDLGNPDARQWVVGHVEKIMADEGVDIYRQDFNFAPLGYWRANDAPDRQGITEIRHVTGYLAFWDELRRRHPGLLIDTCASGGRRNDLETLRRSVPLHKSDMEYPNLTAKQTQLYGIASWVPYFGAPVYPAGRVDVYGFRSGIAPMTGLGYDSRTDDLDYALLRRLVGEWRRVAPILLHGDYYPLGSWSAANDVWMAWQFDWPSNNQGLIEAFRRPDSPYESARFRLRGLDRDADYELVNADHQTTTTMSGRELMETGLLLTLKGRPSAALITYSRR
jgi:alpha-galactosidase